MVHRLGGRHIVRVGIGPWWFSALILPACNKSFVRYPFQ